MAGNIKGITIEFRGDTTRLDKALRQVNNETKNIDKELRNVDKALKFNPTSVELWRQKQQLLSQKISETKDKLSLLKQQQQAMDAAGVDKQSLEYQKLKREIIETESKLKTFEGQLKKVGNVNLKAASEQFKQWGSQLEQAGQKMQGLSMAAAGVVASLGLISYKAGTNADDLNTLSKVYGISTQDLQMYAAAGDLVDVSVETIAKSHVKLEKSMSSAASGTGKNAEAFEALGVSLTDADGNLRDSDEVWQDTIKALGEVENETERDALAMQLMGKSAAELNPLIEDGGETYEKVAETMEKYGLDFVDQETLDKANEFNDTLDTMKLIGTAAIAQVGSQLSAYLAPALEKVVGWIGKLASWLSTLSPQVLTVIGIVAGVIAGLAPVLIVLGKLAFAVSSIINLIGVVGPVIAGLAGPIGIAIAIIGALIAIGILLYKNWDVIKAKAIQLWNNIKTTFNGIKMSIQASINAVKTFLTNSWNNIKSTAQATWSNIKTTAQSAWNSIKSTAQSTWNGIKSAIVSPIQNAWSTVKGIVDKLKSLFPINIGKILSNISVPHFSLKWSSKDFGPLGSIRYPTGFDVSWYARGGIFDSPTIAGIGEAGPEAVVPLDRFWEEIQSVNERTDALLARQNQILMAVLEEVSKEKNFKVDGMWAGRYVNSLVR